VNRSDLRPQPRQIGILLLLLVLATSGCGGSSSGASSSSTGSSSSSSTSDDSGSGYPATSDSASAGGADGGGAGVATDCVRPLVTDPSSGSGSTTVSAELDGDWPQDPVIHAEANFMDDTALQTFSDSGRTVTVTSTSGALVSTVKVWVTGGDTPITCNVWVRQP
jgi:hypothetical protein